MAVVVVVGLVVVVFDAEQLVDLVVGWFAVLSTRTRALVTTLRPLVARRYSHHRAASLASPVVAASRPICHGDRDELMRPVLRSWRVISSWILPR